MSKFLVNILIILALIIPVEATRIENVFVDLLPYFVN